MSNSPNFSNNAEQQLIENLRIRLFFFLSEYTYVFKKDKAGEAGEAGYPKKINLFWFTFYKK
jgi:hypothetical protein